MTKHIHHDLIVKWAADTTQVQYFFEPLQTWRDDPFPAWHPNMQYRIRHKHQDLIDQKAARPELIVHCSSTGNKAWVVLNNSNPDWNPDLYYRLVEPAPKTVEMWQWVMQQGTSVNMSPRFFVSAEDATRHYRNKVIQRADWTRITVEVQE